MSITIRNVPESTRDDLAARAGRSGRSLQEYLLMRLNELASSPDPTETLEAIRGRARHYPPVDAEAIVSGLDAERR